MRFGTQYFLRDRQARRTSILTQYEGQWRSFRMRPAVNASLRRSKEQAERAAEAATEAMQKAQAANRTKTEFLANMSHELRTPLNAIIGFSEAICERSLGPARMDKYFEYARDIHSSGKHLLDLINDILDLAKVEFGKATLHEESVDLDALMAACLRLVAARAQANRLELRYEPCRGLASLWVDERKFKQIVINLLSNAVKFTPAGGKVAVSTERMADGGLAFRVADSGIGIAPEDIERALAPFSQIDSRLSRKYEGTGLGLPLCKALAELHGGSLRLDSRPGAGTTVTIRLPAHRMEWNDFDDR